MHFCNAYLGSNSRNAFPTESIEKATAHHRTCQALMEYKILHCRPLLLPAFFRRRTREEHPMTLTDIGLRTARHVREESGGKEPEESERTMNARATWGHYFSRSMSGHSPAHQLSVMCLTPTNWFIRRESYDALGRLRCQWLRKETLRELHCLVISAG